MNMTDIISICKEKEMKIWEAAIYSELMNNNKTTKQELMEKMAVNYAVIKESIEKGVSTSERSNSGLTGGEGKRLFDYAGGEYGKAAGVAMGVANINAAMGKIVATPTAGSCGIVPGVIYAMQNRLGSTDEDIINSLWTAGIVGKIIATHAGISGAQGGCQFECGTAAAMGAAMAVELMGGSPKQSFDAAALTLKAVMGLVCDPVAGLVEVPCIKRNAFGAVNAILACDMAMSGIESVIPIDEVISAMAEVGASMPACLKETADGGIAKTKTALEICKRVL